MKLSVLQESDKSSINWETNGFYKNIVLPWNQLIMGLVQLMAISQLLSFEV